jgi:hypothetical protein
LKPIALLVLALLISVLIALPDEPSGVLFWSGMGTFFLLVFAAIVCFAKETPYGRS